MSDDKIYGCYRETINEMTNSNPVKVVYRCAVCDEPAATILLIPSEVRDSDLASYSLPGAPATLVSLDVCGSHSLALRSNQVDPVKEKLLAASKEQTPTVGAELSHSYCPECRTCYCDAHWHLVDRWEDLQNPGDSKWYDATHGICPKGHRVLLAD